MAEKNFAHLDQETAKIISLDDGTRIRYVLTEHFLLHHRLKKLINHVQFLVEKPPQTRAWGLVIEAPPGQGKTMLSIAITKRFTTGRREYRRRECKGTPQRPVLSISMTGAREARTIYNRILEELGAVVPRSMRITDREVLTLQLLYEAGVSLLILDEIQDVLRTTLRQRQATLDVIKLIMNKLRIPILALGAKPAGDAFREDPHLNARLRQEEIPLWKANPEFSAFLKGVEGFLPFPEPSHLNSPKMRATILEYSQGVTAQILQLITFGAVFAILEGASCLSEEEIERATREIPPVEALNQDPTRGKQA